MLFSAFTFRQIGTESCHFSQPDFSSVKMSIVLGCAATCYSSFYDSRSGQQTPQVKYVRSQDQRSKQRREIGTGPAPAQQGEAENPGFPGGIKPGRRLVNQEIKKRPAKKEKKRNTQQKEWSWKSYRRPSRQGHFMYSLPKAGSQSRVGLAA